MEAIYNWLNSLLNKNKNEFAQWPDINWLNSINSYSYYNQRDSLLNKIDNSILFNDTKPYHSHISKGCSICGLGKWSCLFITNKCNAGCFYCPAPQTNDELPSTQGLDFNNALDYADYVKHFNFEGVSFSGGEPLLYFKRTLEYLKAVRKQCRNDVYIWMYTNGILADTERLKTLANEGLNEVRFDIGATGFTLDKVKLAKGIIPNITIEIPAIPEEKDKLISMLPKMVEAGVTNLNLHQLRITQHNADKLTKRGYTIISAEKPLVLESELVALEIINTAKEQGLNIGINYCSFHFKNRFQKAGYRKIIANKILPGANISSNGYIREFSSDTICYKTIKLTENISEIPYSSTIQIEGKTYSYVVHTVFCEKDLSVAQRISINNLLETEPKTPPADPLLFRIWQYEYLERGLWAL